MTKNVITPEVLEQFLKNAPEFKPFLQNVDLELVPCKTDPPERLIRTIIYQQLAGNAAKAIYDRFKVLVNEDLSPENILKFSVDQMREVGISRQKAGYILNVASAFLSRMDDYRNYHSVRNLSSETIRQLFSSIKGIGSWSVNMYLIFSLGRLDVIAAGDLGVRKGVARIYNLETDPSKAETRKIAQNWQPYATIGCLACWRILD